MGKAPVLVAIAGALLLLGAIWIRHPRVQVAPKPVVAKRSFDRDSWISFRVGDFRQSAIEIDKTLRLAADTRGTPPGTWKHLGVRSAAPIPLREGTFLSISVEWPENSDTSSMSASIVLSPYAIPGDPRTSSEWIDVSSIGTGLAAGRLVVTSDVDGVSLTHFSEETPRVDFAGRPASRQDVRITVSNRTIQIEEDGWKLTETGPPALPSDQCFLYLMLSSDSNFPLREVQFSELKIVQP